MITNDLYNCFDNTFKMNEIYEIDEKNFKLSLIQAIYEVTTEYEFTLSEKNKDLYFKEKSKGHADLIIKPCRGPFSNQNPFVKRKKNIQIRDKMIRGDIDNVEIIRTTKKTITTVDIATAFLTITEIINISIDPNDNISYLPIVVTIFINVINVLNKKEKLSEREINYLKLFLLNTNFGKEEIFYKDFMSISKEQKKPSLFRYEYEFQDDMRGFIEKGIFEKNRGTQMLSLKEKIIFN